MIVMYGRTRCPRKRVMSHHDKIITLRIVHREDGPTKKIINKKSKLRFVGRYVNRYRGGGGEGGARKQERLRRPGSSEENPGERS